MRPSLPSCLLLALFLSGCGIFGGPAEVELEFRAAPRLNPNQSGESTTVYVHVYQLRDDRAWKDANHLLLWQNGAAELGESVLGSPVEVLLDAGRTTPVPLKLHEDAKFIGVMGLFNQSDAQRGWQQCVPVDEADDLPFRFEEFTIVREAQ